MNRDAWIGLVALVVVVSLGYQGLQLIGIIDEEGEAFERTCEQYGGHVTQTCQQEPKSAALSGTQ